MGLGNRGMDFEKLINLSKNISERGDVAYKQVFDSREGG